MVESGEELLWDVVARPALRNNLHLPPPVEIATTLEAEHFHQIQYQPGTVAIQYSTLRQISNVESRVLGARVLGYFCVAGDVEQPIIMGTACNRNTLSCWQLHERGSKRFNRYSYCYNNNR